MICVNIYVYRTKESFTHIMMEWFTISSLMVISGTPRASLVVSQGKGFPGGKESACKCRRPSFSPASGRSPGKGDGPWKRK